MPWYVLYTKPRNEKKLTALLSKAEFTVYCPVKEEIRQWSDRKKKVSEPVFKSYIFVFLDDYQLQCSAVLSMPGALHFLWWNKKPGVVREEEIKRIEEFLTSYKHAEINIALSPGEKVMINEGILADKDGIVLYTQGNMVYLRLNSIGLNMVAKIPVQSLKKSI
jgi:transcription antitermination factor NusG